MKTYIIIGAAAAGISALNTLIKLDPQSRVLLFSDESENPYNKCFLADYLHKIKQEDELSILKHELTQLPNVHLFLGTRVLAILSTPKKIILHDGTEISYDALFIATGSSPRVPSIPGLIGSGVFTFHTIADANKIVAYANDRDVKRVGIVGGGLSGLECADALRAWGLEVMVIEQNRRVLERQVDEQGGAYIAKLMVNAGVELLCNQMVSEVIRENDLITAIKLSSGTVQQIDMVIIATGLKPNVELAQSANLALQQGYIEVNSHMRTSDENIFAGGDCVMVHDQMSQQIVPSCTWPDAMQQGNIAAYNMAGIAKVYPGAAVITSSAFFGKTFVTCGMVNDVPADYEIRVNQNDDFYHKIVLCEGRVKGYLLIGNTQIASKLKRAILTGEKY